MYQPVQFAETDLFTVRALIREYPLGLLISSDATGIQANPLPFILDENRGDNGSLQAHLARANPQWKHIKGGASVLVVFQGPDAYVTPSWYATKKEHGKVVPTWNYVMVQVRGTVAVHDDPHWLQAQVTALTDQLEQGRDHAWKVTDAPERYIEMQKRGIVGIEISINDIRGKWKVSQNRSSADQAGVAVGYEKQGDEVMAALVRDRMKL